MPSDKLTIEWATGEPKLLEITETVHIVTALVTDWSLNFIKNHLSKESSIKILIGILLPTNVKVLECRYACRYLEFVKGQKENLADQGKPTDYLERYWGGKRRKEETLD